MPHARTHQAAAAESASPNLRRAPAAPQPDTATLGRLLRNADRADDARRHAAENPTQLAAVQKSAGNRAVQRLLAHPVQAKLTVGPARDAYEREADQVAKDAVQLLRAPQAEPPPDVEEGAPPDVQRRTAPTVQRRADPLGGLDLAPDLESSIESARGGGRPLSSNVRAPMEQAFGADFGNVRVHTGPQADHLSRSVQAKAFTTGSDVFLSNATPATSSADGQELLAHELTHVVQQGGAK